MNQNQSKNNVIAILVMIVLIFGALLALSAHKNVSNVAVEQNAGANPGPDHTVHQNFFAGYTSGGSFASSTSGATDVFSSYSFRDVSSILYTPNVSDVTFSFPASSTLTDFVPKKGDVRDIYFRNGTTTPGIDVTFAGSAGVILEIASTTSSSNPSAGAGKGGFFRFWRSATSTDIYAIWNPSQ